MQAGDGRDQAEAEAIARCIAALFEPIEALENLIVLTGGNSRSVVGDRNHGHAAHIFTGNHDLPGEAAVLERIVDDVGDRVENQVAIAGDHYLAVTDHDETGTTLLGCGVIQLDHLARDLGQVDAAKPALSYLALDLRDPRDRQEYPQHGIELGDGVADQRLIGLAMARPVPSLFEASAHPGQRRAQVVGHVVTHLLDLAHQGFDAIQHVVEVLCNAIPFVAGATERDALVQPARHDGAAGGVDRLDPPYRAARHKDACHCRHDEGQCNDRNDGHLDLSGERVEVADVPPDEQPVAAGKFCQHGPHQRVVRGIRRGRRRAKFRPSRGRCRRRPILEIAGKDRRRAIGQKIEMLGKTAVGGPQPDQIDQPVATGLLVSFAQAGGLGDDRTVRPAAHIG